MAQDFTSTGFCSGTTPEFFASQIQAPKFLPYLTTGLEKEMKKSSSHFHQKSRHWNGKTHDHFDLIPCESLRWTSSTVTWQGAISKYQLHEIWWFQGAGRNWHLPYVSHQRDHKIPSNHWRSHLKIQAVHILGSCFMTCVQESWRFIGWVFVLNSLAIEFIIILNHTWLNLIFVK